MLHLVIHSQIKKMKSENETLFCFNNAKIKKIKSHATARFRQTAQTYPTAAYVVEIKV